MIILISVHHRWWWAEKSLAPFGREKPSTRRSLVRPEHQPTIASHHKLVRQLDTSHHLHCFFLFIHLSLLLYIYFFLYCAVNRYLRGCGRIIMEVRQQRGGPALSTRVRHFHCGPTYTQPSHIIIIIVVIIIVPRQLILCDGAWRGSYLISRLSIF